MSSITLEDPPVPEITIGIHDSAHVSLDGGVSSLVIDRSGPVIEIHNGEPAITDLLAHYILSSN